MSCHEKSRSRHDKPMLLGCVIRGIRACASSRFTPLSRFIRSAFLWDGERSVFDREIQLSGIGLVRTRTTTDLLLTCELARNSRRFILPIMSTVHEIEMAVSKLSRQELSAFRELVLPVRCRSVGQTVRGGCRGGAFGRACRRSHPRSARGALHGFVRQQCEK